MARPKKIKEELVPQSPTEAKDQVDSINPEDGIDLKTYFEKDNESVRTGGVEVVPSITVVGGKKNALVNLFEGDQSKLPVLKSVGYGEIPGTNTFVAYVIYSKGGNILKIEVEEPNLRVIAEESAKIFFVNAFMTGEEHVPG